MYGTTRHFSEDVLARRPYLQLDWCIQVIESYVRREVQANGRVCFWGFVEELWAALPSAHGRALKVVTLEDEVTIHTAYPDRDFRLEGLDDEN